MKAVNSLIKIEDYDKINGRRIFNKEAFIQALDNLIHIQLGSFPFNRDIGTRVPEYLFMYMNIATSHMIKHELVQQIKRQLSGIDSTVEVDIKMDFDNRVYKIDFRIETRFIDDVIFLSRELKLKD